MHLNAPTSSRMGTHKKDEINCRDTKKLHFLGTWKSTASEFGILLHIFSATQSYRKFRIIL